MESAHRPAAPSRRSWASRAARPAHRSAGTCTSALFSPKIARDTGYPTKMTEPRLGCSPPGRRQERRAQDALARERLEDSGGLERLRLPLLPNRGAAEPLGDAATGGGGMTFH